MTVTFTPGYAGPRPVPLQVASSAGTFYFGMTGIGTAPMVALSPGIIGDWDLWRPISSTPGRGGMAGG